MDLQEQKIIQRAKKGDPEAMELIFRQHLDRSIRLAFLITRNWATAEDAVQEAFLQAFRALDSFEDNRPFKPWFTRIVVNSAKRTKDRLDRGHFPYEVEEINPHRSFSPEEHALDKEDLERVFQAINSLDDNHRYPVLLKYLSGLTEAETAEALDIPISTVKSRLYVARKRLENQLEILKGGQDHEFRS